METDETRRVIFREEALHHYQKGQEQIVLPRFITPPTIAILWCLVIFILIGSVTSWFWRVPAYVTTLGEVGMQQADGQQEMFVLLIVSTDQISRIHVGLPVQLQVGQSGPQWQQHITSFDATLLSPEQIRSGYHLDNAASLLVEQPSAVALVQVAPSLATPYSGSIVQAKIQTGTQRIISLLPGLGNLGGE